MAATNLAKCIQKLYQNRDDDNLADFVIESSDRKQIKVHSFILSSRLTLDLILKINNLLLFRGSDFFEKMLTRFSNFEM